MSAKRLMLEMAIIFPISFIAAALTTFAYTLVVHGGATVDWDGAFQLAVILAIVLPFAGVTIRARTPHETS